ncbi:Gfo/Idh/MocA family protein [Halalkalibacter akibai]|uniref:Myo-inositol 2-dehydrogenase n=1 Tax=Halalkalibacter akibai (strain ATCC 43226 / DSM 21942 / CIP 109018 / JCM 9157 / 1139) TaxID=1236973 RepID=W4QXA8_HALA3|nr:Gfo/Idh/MocA family oxidoreductase [Halalkalibacter akibai]GAE36283.1 myo-inositol 2-dehydrogenase [Halalkalibacter akibai JCM 9157]
MSTQTKISIGVIGAGNIGNVHLENFNQLKEDVEIKAITDVYLPLAEKRAEEYQIPTVHQNADELINNQELDAVIIAVPNKYHAPLTIQALKAGKHVLLEKPMAINENDAKEILLTQKKTGKIVMIPHQMRWESLALQVKEQVERGELGNIYHAKAGWLRRKGIPGWGTWFTQKNESGGGPLIDIGVHLLDLSLYLMGNPKPVSVFGSTYAEFGPKKKGIGTWGTPNWDGAYDVEDIATALIKMEDGSTLSLDVSWAVHMDTDNQPYLHLLGSEGGASIQGKKGKLLTEMFDRPIDVDLTSEDEKERLRLSQHFVECIREGKEPISSAVTGYTNNLILSAIYESSRTGREVQLNWDVEGE